MYKILEIHTIITKKIRNPCEHHENYENQWNSNENHENHENQRNQ